eukprot:Skav218978  [mRNA]  locus=scaffold1532:291483:294850:+ [translate_table: standard]
MRAVAPLAIGAAGGGFTLRWFLQEAAREVSSHLAISASRSLVLGLLPEVDWTPWINKLWTVGGLLICWELRVELVELLRILVLGILQLVRLLLWLHNWFGGLAIGSAVVYTGYKSDPRTERDFYLTCMAALVGPVPQAGTFMLVSRPPNWDEIWVAGISADGQDLVGRTTSSDGAAWVWVIVRPVALQVVAPVTGGATRQAPPGVGAGAVNWICVPPQCTQQWDPDPLEVIALTQEANRYVAHLQANPGSLPCNQAGVAGDLQEATLPAPAMAPGGAGVVAGAGGPGAGGAGWLELEAQGQPGWVCQPEDNAELKALEAAVRRVQRAWLSMGGSTLQAGGFEAYFLRAMRALEVGFAAASGGQNLDDRFRSLMVQLGRCGGHGEFKSTGKDVGCGESPSHVFPLVPMTRDGSFMVWSSAESREGKLCRAGGNMVVACLNWLHGGQHQRDFELVATAAHRRVHSRIERALKALVMTDEPVLTQEGLDQFLRQSEFYTGDGVSLALGVRGGVPDKAADVPLADHLMAQFPGVSLEHPTAGWIQCERSERV